MPRGFRVDIPASIERFGDKGLRNGRWRSGFSFISLPKQIGEHGGAHLILQKKDPRHAEQVAEVRAEIFRRNRQANDGNNKCVECGVFVFELDWEDSDLRRMMPRGEWDHIENAPARRCDCPENGRVLCNRDHRARHIQTQFGVSA